MGLSNDIQPEKLSVAEDFSFSFESGLRPEVKSVNPCSYILRVPPENIRQQSPPAIIFVPAPTTPKKKGAIKKQTSVIPHASLLQLPSLENFFDGSCLRESIQGELDRCGVNDFFDPKSPIFRWISNMRRTSAMSSSLSWQHKLLYRPRCYVADSLVDGVIPDSADLKNYIFYRRLLEGFEDNWVLPRPLIACHADGLDLCFVIPPFYLSATRVSTEGLQKYEAGCTVEQPSLTQLCANLSREAFAPRDNLAWLDPKSHRLWEASSLEQGTFFDLDWIGVCRLVARSTRLYKTTETSRNVDDNILSCLRETAANGELLAISSQSIATDCESLQPTILAFFGGKDMLAFDWLPFISRFYHNMISREAAVNMRCAGKGLSCLFKTLVLLFEYPGYGFSVGKASPSSCVESSLRVLEKLRSQYGLSQLHIRIVGYSLGAGVALRVASELAGNSSDYAVKSVLLMAPPTNIPACAAHIMRVPQTFRPAVATVLSRLETETSAWENEGDIVSLLRRIISDLHRHSEFELAIVHGTRDTLVECSMGKSLIAAAHATIRAAMETTTSREKRKQLEGLKDRVKFEAIQSGTHLSIAAEPAHQKVVYKYLFFPDMVELY